MAAELSPVRNRAEAIRHELLEAERYWQSAVGHAIRAGELLAEQKADLKHGEWLPWLAEHVPELPERTAQHYMRLAGNRELVARLPTVRAAIAALAEPKPESTAKSATVADIPRADGRTRRVPTPVSEPEPEPERPRPFEPPPGYFQTCERCQREVKVRYGV